MPPKLHIWNQRMLILLRHCIDTERVDSQKAFLESIKFPPENIHAVKVGRQGFTMEQMVNAAKKYDVSINWLAGLDDKMKRQATKNPIIRLKEIASEFEAAGKSKR